MVASTETTEATWAEATSGVVGISTVSRGNCKEGSGMSDFHFF